MLAILRFFDYTLPRRSLHLGGLIRRVVFLAIFALFLSAVAWSVFGAGWLPNRGGLRESARAIERWLAPEFDFRIALINDSNRIGVVVPYESLPGTTWQSKFHVRQGFHWRQLTVFFVDDSLVFRVGRELDAMPFDSVRAFGIAEVLDDTSNVLSKVNILLVAFAAAIAVFSLLVAFGGYRFVRQINVLETRTKKADAAIFDAASVVAVHVPVLGMTQLIPDEHYEAIRSISSILRSANHEIRDEIREKNDYGRLVITGALEYWISGDFERCSIELDRIWQTGNYDMPVRELCAYRLSHAYRQLAASATDGGDRSGRIARERLDHAGRIARTLARQKLRDELELLIDCQRLNITQDEAEKKRIILAIVKRIARIAGSESENGDHLTEATAEMLTREPISGDMASAQIITVTHWKELTQPSLPPHLRDKIAEALETKLGFDCRLSRSFNTRAAWYFTMAGMAEARSARRDARDHLRAAWECFRIAIAQTRGSHHFGSYLSLTEVHRDLFREQLNDLERRLGLPDGNGRTICLSAE